MKIISETVTLAVCIGLSPVIAGLVSGCDHRSPQSVVVVDDSTLSSRVRSALSDNKEFKFDDVKVMTSGGIVQLSGFVNTSEQKKSAGEIAKGVPGAKSVENNITVKDSISSR